MAADQTITRVLVVHPDEATQTAVEKALRSGAVSVFEAASPGEGLVAAGRLKPHLILLDLSENREFALEVARELRGTDALIAGLYNPLLLPPSEASDFFRTATRSGVADFVVLPVGKGELGDVLAATAQAASATIEPTEGRLVTFLGAKGGVGKSTVAINTALVMAGSETVAAGVAFCDAGLPFGTAVGLVGLAPDRDLADLARDLDSGSTLGAYLDREPQTELAVLAAPRDPYDEATVSPDALSRILVQLRRRFGKVVVNAPAAVDLLTLAALDLSDTVYVITDAVAPTVLAARRLVAVLTEQGWDENRMKIVLNRCGGPGQLAENLVAEQIGRVPDYRVPYDAAVVEGSNRGESPLLSRPESPFSVAIGEIGEAIVGEAARAQ